ncbi:MULTISPECIES: MarR family winged helix-turn-helix transcriptional regulator [Brucella]|uniref:MarR family winged helix-turn-helix transcriptional regulator n=1 Tax=Brucella/Ochrobactrum group TaxID=2826938 RepID=UPI0009A1F7A9|nr:MULTISPECIES: MarR family winged helix-turn-helix transcriptional regulator [Brucella]MBK0021030.1 winged helix-turn-helix transcriptional regulator [Ochrobactrum sp. S45]MBK0042232.1 winged helix-turn-helix transcriptional regulator [Ochrobactrum sp. S46]MQP38769.1 hypothetical protein [Ochrobactrum sp. MYb237]QWK78633.1 MarR family winged helix-turn-helix transcriptional regulator [Ochrobactrum sp. BTU1]PQZ43388.1 MarR family transcriptional regulator [Brucella pseudogrignonensis]
MTASNTDPKADQATLARKLAAILALFQGDDNTMQINLLTTFLHIKANGETPHKKLELLMDATGASVSRNIAKLSEEGYKKRDGQRDPGMGLVKSTEMSNDKSAKAATLTPAGQAVFDEFVRILRSGNNGS